MVNRMPDSRISKHISLHQLGRKRVVSVCGVPVLNLKIRDNAVQVLRALENTWEAAYAQALRDVEADVQFRMAKPTRFKDGEKEKVPRGRQN